jgi:hypothetical protein
MHISFTCYVRYWLYMTERLIFLMEELCINWEVQNDSLYTIQNNFSLFELHAPYRMLHQRFQNFFYLQSTWKFWHCTLHHLFAMPSIEMRSIVKCNAVLYYGQGCVWRTARKRIIKNISSEIANFSTSGKERHWRFQGRNTAIQLVELNCSARKYLGTNMWHNFTETMDSECIHYLAWFKASVEKYMRSVLFWVITQRIVAISYRRFGKMSHLQGWVNPRTWISWLLKMGQISCTETW